MTTADFEARLRELGITEGSFYLDSAVGCWCDLWARGEDTARYGRGPTLADALAQAVSDAYLSREQWLALGFA